MDGVPDDVDLTATIALDAILASDSQYENHSIIARAILAERKRCAAVARAYGTTPGFPDGKTGAFRKHRHLIAKAIESGQ